MDRILTRLPTLESLLWLLASVTALAALIILLPALLNSPAQPRSAAWPGNPDPRTPTGSLETLVASALSATATAQVSGSWTPAPTRTPVAIPIALLTPVGRGVIPPDKLFKTPVPQSIEDAAGHDFQFLGNILFISDRSGKDMPLLMQPDSQVNATLTGMDLYDLARSREEYSPDRTRRAESLMDLNGIRQIVITNLADGAHKALTAITRGNALDPVWSPDGNRIAYVSTETGVAEIYVYDIGAKKSRRLTGSADAFTLNQHPSWSPDSARIVWSSNRETGRFQVWIMNADGTGLRNLSDSGYNDMAPVWVKGP